MTHSSNFSTGSTAPVDDSPWERALREAVDWSIWLGDDPDDPETREAFTQWLAADPLHGKAWQETVHASDLIAQTKGVSLFPKANGNSLRTRRARSMLGARKRTFAAMAAAVAILWMGFMGQAKQAASSI